MRFAQSQVAEQLTAQVHPTKIGRGIAEQIGLAAHLPSDGGAAAHTARALWFELPDTYAQLATGRLSERIAETVVAETRHLDPDTRRQVDTQLHAAGITEWGSKQRPPVPASSPTRQIGRAICSGAAPNATPPVGLRPAPDTMAVLTGYLPVEQGIACYAALRQHADTAVATGDGRTRDQIMADTLVERLTGQTKAGDVNVELQLMMPLDALINPNDPSAAVIPGYGPLPQELAWEILTTSRGRKWWRRLFTAPSGVKGRSGMIMGGDPDAPSLRRLAHQVDSTARPNLPRPILRRTHPPHRSHHPPRRRRTNHLHQRPWRLRPRQSGPGNAGLAYRTHRLRLPQRAARDQHHHTHRPPLPQPRTRPTMTVPEGAPGRSRSIIFAY